MSDDFDKTAGDLVHLGTQIAGQAHKLVVTWTAALQRQVMLNAGGRPGPNAPTGDYRRSITRKTVKLAGQSIGVVGTNKPQGLRLELGFVGTDSIGRNYNQPPYPHFGPAADFVGAGFLHAAEKIAVPHGGGAETVEPSA